MSSLAVLQRENSAELLEIAGRGKVVKVVNYTHCNGNGDEPRRTIGKVKINNTATDHGYILVGTDGIKMPLRRRDILGILLVNDSMVDHKYTIMYDSSERQSRRTA